MQIENREYDQKKITGKTVSKSDFPVDNTAKKKEPNLVIFQQKTGPKHRKQGNKKISPTQKIEQ